MVICGASLFHARAVWGWSWLAIFGYFGAMTLVAVAWRFLRRTRWGQARW